jgi:hypothetical protein
VPNRTVLTITLRKFFTFVLCLNAVGMLLVIFGIWDYPKRYTGKSRILLIVSRAYGQLGALVLGNLQMAVLMRNELFGRILYLIVNTLFAKVCLSYVTG